MRMRLPQLLLLPVVSRVTGLWYISLSTGPRQHREFINVYINLLWMCMKLSQANPPENSAFQIFFLHDQFHDCIIFVSAFCSIYCSCGSSPECRLAWWGMVLIGFILFFAHTAVCDSPCQNEGVCSEPNVCDCSSTGYTGTVCQTRKLSLNNCFL